MPTIDQLMVSIDADVEPLRRALQRAEVLLEASSQKMERLWSSLMRDASFNAHAVEFSRLFKASGSNGHGNGAAPEATNSADGRAFGDDGVAFTNVAQVSLEDLPGGGNILDNAIENAGRGLGRFISGPTTVGERDALRQLMEELSEPREIADLFQSFQHQFFSFLIFLVVDCFFSIFTQYFNFRKLLS